MIKKVRLQAIWRRTRFLFFAIQVVAMCVFLLDLEQSIANEVSTKWYVLGLAYIAFLVFSAVVFWSMIAVRKLVERMQDD